MLSINTDLKREVVDELEVGENKKEA